MEFAWTSSENEAERLAAMTIAQLNAKARSDLGEYTANRNAIGQIGGLVADIFKTPLTGLVTKLPFFN
jgi:hypothetical protein